MATALAPSPTQTTQSDQVPRPVSPLDGALVDASAAAFTWHGVPKATGYTLQIATEPTFTDDVLEVTAGTATELTLFGTLPVSEAELYWRVRAEGTGESYSGYGRFVAAGDDAVDAYQAEQEAKRAAEAKEIAKARAEQTLQNDLIPPYQRPGSVTSTALLFTMSFLLVSFLMVIAAIMAIMNNGPA
ncbi:MAG: hypothetical protein AAGG50_11870 [Bacteroidota bacterium]